MQRWPAVRCYYQNAANSGTVSKTLIQFAGIRINGWALSSTARFFNVKDPELLIRVMSTNPSYLQSTVDDEVIQYRDWGIPLGRRFRALKLWFHLRLDGPEAIRQRLRRDLENANWFAEQVRNTEHWQVVAPVNLQTVCIRHNPPGLETDALDAHTLAWVNSINQSGVAFMSASQLDGRWMVRVSIGVESTTREHVEALWTLIQGAVEK